MRKLFEHGETMTITVPHGQKVVREYDGILVSIDPLTYEGADVQHFHISLFCLKAERSITERVNVRYKMTECVYQVGMHRLGGILLSFVPRSAEYPLQFSLVG